MHCHCHFTVWGPPQQTNAEQWPLIWATFVKQVSWHGGAPAARHMCGGRSIHQRACWAALTPMRPRIGAAALQKRSWWAPLHGAAASAPGAHALNQVGRYMQCTRSSSSAHLDCCSLCLLLLPAAAADTESNQSALACRREVHLAWQGARRWSFCAPASRLMW